MPGTRTSTLRDLVDGLAVRRLPEPGADRPDPLAAAWAASDDLDAMIGLLRVGGHIGLFGIDGVQEWRPAHGEPTSRWLFRLRTPEGRFVRVDVTREAGAGAVRTILPVIPAMDAWKEALQGDYERRDPIDQLRLDIEHRGAPSREWEERWGAGEQGLQAAWAASRDSLSMRWLLDWLGHPDVAARAQAALEAVPPPPPSPGYLPVSGALEAWKMRVVDAIRSAVPHLPRRARR
jgi:hypothetical protein